MPKRLARVAIIDDNTMTRVILEAYLDRLGHTVVGGAADGEEGIELVRVTAPDVVLLDVHLPTTNGFRVLEQLKSLPLETIVIMLSGSDEAGFVRKAVDMGAASYLTKPFTLESIEAALDASLSSRDRGFADGASTD